MKEQGFTLVEIMVAIAVLATVISFAIPTFDQAIAQYRVRQAAAAQASALREARSRAVQPGNSNPITLTIVGNTAQYVGLSGTPTAVAFSPEGRFGTVDTNTSTFSPVSSTVTYTFSHSKNADARNYLVKVERSGKVVF